MSLAGDGKPGFDLGSCPRGAQMVQVEDGLGDVCAAIDVRPCHLDGGHPGDELGVTARRRRVVVCDGVDHPGRQVSESRHKPADVGMGRPERLDLGTLPILHVDGGGLGGPVLE